MQLTSFSSQSRIFMGSLWWFLKVYTLKANLSPFVYHADYIPSRIPDN